MRTGPTLSFLTSTTISPISRSLTRPHVHLRSFHSSQIMRTLSVDSLNPAIRNVEYAVRGELAIRAEHYRHLLQKPNHGLPFDRVINSNIGNPQQKGLDQPPITWTRQVCQCLCVIGIPSSSPFVVTLLRNEGTPFGVVNRHVVFFCCAFAFT